MLRRRMFGGAAVGAACRRCALSEPPRTAPATEGGAASDEEGDVVTPWSVTSKGPRGIDYQRVMVQFQSQPVTDALVARVAAAAAGVPRREAPPPPVHRFLTRGIAFSHRDLDLVLGDVEANNAAFATAAAAPAAATALDPVSQPQLSVTAARAPFYLYTGRGPSAAAMHIGHMLPFLLCKYIQDAFHCPFVIQLTDDEKFLFRDLPLKKMASITTSNIKDIIAFGFDRDKTFVFRNTEYMGDMYPTVLELQRLFTCNAVKNTFGFGDSDSVGKYAFAATQAAPAFVSAFPQVLPLKSAKLRCLIPCAIDQDPFFLLTRSVCDRLKRPKPALLHTTFLPALKGATAKMSSSAEQNGTIFLTDDDDAVRRKIRSSFSGGQATLEQLRQHGADLDADVAFQYLRFFDADDARLADTGAAYRRGALSSGAVKELATDAVLAVLHEWRARRAAVTDDDVAAFCARRSLL